MKFNAVTHVSAINSHRVTKMANLIQSLDGTEIISISYCNDTNWYIFVKFDNSLISEKEIKEKTDVFNITCKPLE